MTEYSLFWNTVSGVGDGAGEYTFQQFQEFLRAMFSADDHGRAIVPGAGSDLAVTTPGSNRVTVATGRALVNGSPYVNDAPLEVTIPTRTQTTRHALVLRWTRAAQTVRVQLKSNPAGVVTELALEQTATLHEVGLASLLVTAGGNVTITDQRAFVQWGVASLRPDSVTGTQIADDAVDTAQLAADSVTAVQIADGAIGPMQVSTRIVQTATNITPHQMRLLTATEYDNLTNVDADTLYLIRAD